FDLVDSGIERCRLAATGRTGHQHHAVGFLDIAPEFPQIIFIEADDVQSQRAKLLTHGFLVEHAQHRVLAMNRRHDRYTEINGPPRLTVFHAEASILRYAPFRDIELAHDLNARNDGRMVFARDRRHGLRQNAVNAEFYGDRIVARLNVNIAGPPLQGGKDCRVHEPDDRTHVALRRQLVNRDALVAALFFMHDGKGESLAGIFQHAL